MKHVLGYVLGLVVVIAVIFSPGIARADGAGELKDGDYVGIIGDSITEQQDYSVLMEDYLLMCKPAQNLRASQFGWGGETAPGFAGRMANDMVPFGCTVATTSFGMNDGHYQPMSADTAAQYLKGQTSIIEQLKKAGVRLIVVGSPNCVDSDSFRHDPNQAIMYNKTLAAERDIDRKLAQDEGVVFADVFDPMMDVMAKMKAKYGHGYALCGPNDGIHPDRNGHTVMAYAFLKALGCDGNIGTITVDLGNQKAEATEGHKIISVKDGAVTVESSKYPFCFYGDPSKTDSSRGVLEFLPFNEDLNRFKLVVNNAGGDKLKVTWGATSKEFSAGDLQKGINLASEFADNPFSQPFREVEQKIAHQQNREVDLVKSRIHNLPGYGEWLSEDKDILAKMRDELVKADQPLRDAAAEAVKPVTHVIKIEVVK